MPITESRKLRKWPALAVALAVGCATGGVSQATRTSPGSRAGPKLVVLVVVDQLGADLLPRYSEAFTSGFRRLLDDGFRFTEATHDHAVTSTAPGHATLATGVYPSRHHIVANEWYELQDGEWKGVQSVDDPDFPVLGYSSYRGRSSVKLDREGLADWVLAADEGARGVSISRKDVAAILLSGKARTSAYWLLQQSGTFATSTFYEDHYASWVVHFNEEVLPSIYSDTVWESRIPDRFLGLTRPDTSEWEGRPGHSYFPHIARAETTREGDVGLNSWRYGTPLPDLAVLELAQEAVRQRELGQRGAVDFLALSFSQADAMGHAYGPRSREQLDNLIRLDGLLGRLMTFLDDAVGADNWVMALSSDHGVSDIPELLDPPVARVDIDEVREVLRTAQAAVVGGGSASDITGRLVEALEPLPSIRRVLTFSELAGPPPGDSIARFFANSHVPDRPVNQLARFSVYLHWKPHSLVAPSWVTRRTGTDHRSAYYFDRWVPLIFYGAGVGAGSSQARASTVDVAPTLAALAGIPAPSDLDGRVLIRHDP